MAKKINKQDALHYHSKGRPGKIEVNPTKDTKTQWDLSLAYAPGVAEPCMEIHKNPEEVYKYTSKGNLVAVITDGSAVLGLGDIGPEAGKPVMEGKGVLFKIYADIDVFDLELDINNPDEFVNVVKALEPTFGGINLEDIKSPECFEIEERLKKELNIPVMHDDQHGTAIISAAALLNALELVNKKIDEVSFVVSGAGAAAVACVNLYISLGAKPKNILMFDSEGPLTTRRTDLIDLKKPFARDTDIETLAEAMKNCDVFIGLSAGGVLKPEMLKTMAPDPIVFAMANPDPEIDYNTAMAVRDDVIMATGRSDYPNQVNNVLGFPYIFRGALDVRATQINEEMKLAAVHALAELTKLPVPDLVNMAYDEKVLTFGPDYIIPKPMDPRLISTVSPAVARAAMETGVARKPITNWEAYHLELESRLGLDHHMLRAVGQRARKNPKRVVFAEADNTKVLKAAQVAQDEGIAIPILLGEEKKIRRLMKENSIDLHDAQIIDTDSDDLRAKRREFGEYFFEKRWRRGFNLYEAIKIMRDRNYFGCMMVEKGEADALISGLTRKYPDTIRPALQTIGMKTGVKRVAGMYITLTDKGPLFLADTTINLNPTVEELADITLLTARNVRKFNVTPRIAMLSYSNFGSSQTPEAMLVRDALQLVKEQEPDLVVDGEIQASMAFNEEAIQENYPLSDLVGGGVNTLIFPNLAAGNIAYNLLMEVAEFDTIGPVLMGLDKPVHILQLGSTVRQIVNMVSIAVVDAQEIKESNRKQ